MPLKIIRNDITTVQCDAIVNAANSALIAGGGVDGAIHKAAGSGLQAECLEIGGCKTGEAVITGAYNLPCKAVIHTVGPIWEGGDRGEENLLRSCYRNSLAIAGKKKFVSIAFPIISSGVYGYPKDRALKIAVDEITAFLLENEMTVYLVVYDKSAFKISSKLFDDITAYIDDKYVDEHIEYRSNRLNMDDINCIDRSVERDTFIGETCILPPMSASVKNAESLDDALKNLDESFSEMLIRKIDEKGMTDPECYKKANVDRKLFSKIKSDKFYRPSKTTAIAFAIALELSLAETKDMLKKAGFALSHSNKFDVIIEYFISNKNYNIFEINEALFAFDQNLLGF
ncbi:MAG: macro domain-containing protein [Clostridiales bacterium]|nr:macro domain-containing protein [Clostridiales bacterium]